MHEHDFKGDNRVTKASISDPQSMGWVVGRCACGTLQVLVPREVEPVTTGKGEGGPYNDFPFDEVLAQVQEHIRKGHTIFQKFTCDTCGQRLTMEMPNKLYYEGNCDNCGDTTNIKERGCNYLLMMGLSIPEAI